jgi:hypothetical protein
MIHGDWVIIFSRARFALVGERNPPIPACYLTSSANIFSLGSAYELHGVVVCAISRKSIYS